MERLTNLLDVLNDQLGNNEDVQDAGETAPSRETSQQPSTSSAAGVQHPRGDPEERYLLTGGMEGRQLPDSVGSPNKTGPSGAKRNKDNYGAAHTSNAATGSKLPGTSGNTDGMTGAGGTGDDQSRAVATMPRGIHTPTYSWTFKKKHKFLTFGVANAIINEALTSGTVLNRWALTTSLANLPWEYAFMYISPAEFKRLQQFNGVFASKARVRVFQYNPRVAFQTADTTSTQATLNQNKFTSILS